MSDKDFKYYVLRAITGKETEIGEYIERMRETEPFLKDSIGEILIPMETYFQTNKSAKGGRVKRTRPYYSGYVFVQSNLAGETKHLLRRVPGVLGFLGSDDEPESLPDAEVTRLKSVADRLSESLDDSTLSYSVGERVKVIFGPFNGFFGEITEVLAERKKLKILVMVFGRETLMEVDFAQVEKESVP